MIGCVYILQDTNKKFYIGSINDLNKRLRQHNADHTKATRNMNDPKMVLSQKF